MRQNGEFAGTNTKPKKGNTQGTIHQPALKAGEPTNLTPKEKKELQQQLKEKLKRRAALEQGILSIIGGRTGMGYTWEEVIHAAASGDTVGFRFYGASYQLKAEELQEKLQKLLKLIGNPKVEKVAYKVETAERLSQPFSETDRCRELLVKSKLLRDSGLLDQDVITREMLEKWLWEDVERHERARKGDGDDGNVS